jgi:dipeptidyl aminopeptidase/acylaminoacyl peptidase
LPYAIPTHRCASGNKVGGVPTQLLIFNDEGHGIIKLENKLVMYPIVVEFLDRHFEG